MRTADGVLQSLHMTAWVRMEIAQRRYETRVTHWPGNEEALVATSDGHAQEVVWSS